MTQKKKPIPAWVAHSITSGLTLATGFATLQSGIFGAETGRLSAAYAQMATQTERINALEARVDAYRQDIRIVELKNLTLRLQLTGASQPLEYLFRLLEAIERPAWAKLWVPDRDEFVMVYINSTYESRYQVTKTFYVGKTDFQVHTPSNAKTYRENDDAIMSKKHFLEVVETGVGPDNKQGNYVFWKFHIKLPDERELVAGIQVSRAASSD